MSGVLFSELLHVALQIFDFGTTSIILLVVKVLAVDIPMSLEVVRNFFKARSAAESAVLEMCLVVAATTAGRVLLTRAS